LAKENIADPKAIFSGRQDLPSFPSSHFPRRRFALDGYPNGRKSLAAEIPRVEEKVSGGYRASKEARLFPTLPATGPLPSP
jgi:hypothetical protein